MPVDIFGRSATATSFEAASLISLIGTKVSRSGDNLSGDLSLDGHRLKQIPHEPTDTTDGAAASFVIAGDIAVKDAAVLRYGVQTMTVTWTWIHITLKMWSTRQTNRTLPQIIM